LNPTSTSSDAAPAGEGSDWPVLARLPDVSARLPDGGAPRSNRTAAAGFVSYRFDPPQTAEHGAAAVTARSAKPQPFGKAMSAGPAKPHITPRSARGQWHRESSVLPHSDPFAIPRTSLRDRLAPVIRFLVLFALFTAVGTSVLRSGRQATPANELSEPSTAATEKSFETPTLPARADEIEAPNALPTASGPLGTKSPRMGARPKQQGSSARENSQSAIGPASSAARSAASDPKRLPPSLGVRASGPNDGRLENNPVPPPALARLPGYILEAPAQQAYHDQNQSSLH
jgi:hypothetical protein